MWIYVLVVVITVAYTVNRYLTKTFTYWKDKNVVGPRPWPLVGNTMNLVVLKQFIGTYIRELYQKYHNEKIVGFYRTSTPSLLIRDPDIIKNILIKDFDIFADRGIGLSKDGIGYNLFSAESDTWRVLRTKFSPIFTSRKLKNMLPLMIERGDRFLDDIGKANKQVFEADSQVITKIFTVSSIAACAFGLDLDFNDPKLKILHKLDKMVLELNVLAEFIITRPALLKKLDSFLFPAEFTNFFNDLVKTVFTQRNFKPSARNDFMDVILEMKKQKVIHRNKIVDDSEISVEFTDQMVAAQVHIFYVAGFETSSTTLGYLLYELTQNSLIQDKLIEEIDSTLKNNDGKIEYDSLMEMPYMTKVFDETLRKYPILDPLQRAAVADYTIPGTNVTIKKGQIVYIPVSGLHYDEKYYPNPEVFDPERFSPENVRQRHSCVYLPFGNGPRNCIGMRFAKMQSRLFLVKLLSNYHVQACKNTPKKMLSNPKRAILGPSEPIMLNFVRRTDK